MTAAQFGLAEVGRSQAEHSRGTEICGFWVIFLAYWAFLGRIVELFV
jgi:hypothetical protein